MGSFLGGLTHILKTGFDLTDTGHRMRQDKQQQEDRDNEVTRFAVDNGANPVMGGMVNDNGILRPPDKTRVITHKRADGTKVQLELATPEQQRKRQTAAHVQSILDEFQGTSGMRKTQGDESVDLAGREQTARLGANRADKDTDLKQNGVGIPPALAEALGISPEEKRRYMPQDLNALSNVNDNMEQAAARKAKPTRTVQSSQKEEDDNGNVVQVVTYSDGSTEKTPLGKIGKVTKPTGQMSAYEGYRMNRQNKIDAEKKTNTKGLDAAQKEVDTIEGKQAKVRSTHDKALAEYTQLQADLGSQSGIGPLKSNKLTGEARKKAIAKSADLVGVMAGAQTEHGSLESLKQAANKRRESLMGQSGGEADTGDEEAIPQTGNAAAAASPVTVMTPAGPAVFANEGEAAKFRKKHPSLK